MRFLFCVTWMLVATDVLAEPDTFALGSGRDGSLVVDAPTVINVFAPLAADVPAGATTLTIGAQRGGGIEVGALVMLVQSRGFSSLVPIGDPSALLLDAQPSGRFELARVAAVSASQLTLTAPLRRTFFGGGGQVVRVPELESVDVDVAGSIETLPWDGRSGGIIAALVRGTFSNDGLVNVASAGLRGGFRALDVGGQGLCDLLAYDTALGGAKGENVTGFSFGLAQADHAGYGRVANGGGGGNCLNAGGGGGGNGGFGGRGGKTAAFASGEPADGRQVGGQGGVALVATTYVDRLSLGGGGGAGQGNNSLPPDTEGGAGGGAIFLRAAAFSGLGTYSARGSSPPAGMMSPANCDGGGGGGAGGSIVLRATGSVACYTLDARGGNGGVTDSPCGPGGGGGGGVVFLQTSSLAGSCGVSTSSGVAGTFTASSAHWDAEPTAPAAPFNGVAELRFSEGLVFPEPATLTAPASFATVATRRPTFSGTAAAGALVRVQLLGVIVGSGISDGTFAITPAVDLPLGEVTVSVEVERLAVFAPPLLRTFIVGVCAGDVDCSSTRPFCRATETPPVCVECLDTSHCQAALGGRACLASGRCGCASSSDCGGVTPVCGAGGLCRPCSADTECGAPEALCTNAGRCVECETDDARACPDARPFCAQNRCVARDELEAEPDAISVRSTASGAPTRRGCQAGGAPCVWLLVALMLRRRALLLASD